MRGAEECVNGATTASSPSSHQPLIQSSEWEKRKITWWQTGGGRSRKTTHMIRVEMLNGKFQRLPGFDLWHMVYTVCGI